LKTQDFSPAAGGIEMTDSQSMAFYEIVKIDYQKITSRQNSIINFS